MTTELATQTTEPAAGPLARNTAVPQVPALRRGPADHLSRDEVLALLKTMPEWEKVRNHRHGRRPLLGAATILDWLLTHPGDGWQQRWIAAGADDGRAWIDEITADDPRVKRTKHDEVCSGIHFLFLGRVILPGYGFMAGYGLKELGAFRASRRPDLFARLAGSADAQGMSRGQKNAGIGILTKIVIHTGKDIDELTAADFLEFRGWQRSVSKTAYRGQYAAWDLLRGIGVLPADATLTYTRRQPQLPSAELVDLYDVKNPQIRDVLIRYLDERRPAIDYVTLRALALNLVGLFWSDIEQHHPGINSLHLPDDVAAEWKERLRFLKGKPGQVRANPIHVLEYVRAFYLDIQEWALQDASWAPWAAPSPVRKGDTAGYGKLDKKRISRMHQRVRERLPHLPALVASAERYLADRESLLAAAKGTEVGNTFQHAGVSYRRVTSNSSISHPAIYEVPQAWVEDTSTGKRIDAARAEDDAFWTWAFIETLRHTGVRIEELLEITQLALISYRLTDTGELVPMLQIVPSKTGEERLFLVSPELASVLASIISRLRTANGGTVPLVARYDGKERVQGPPLPHLFQRKIAWRSEAITDRTVQRMLNDALNRAGLCDTAGQPLHYTPHDFRRMFTTEAVASGLPVHIAARLLGHSSLATTQAYLAVFQDDLVRTYRAYLATRRAVRPEAEYREPTDEEWREFRQHFELRKVELGECGRPYGTPCKHEHACIRCPMLRVDPRRKGRLAEIIVNLRDRITEARENGWAGEVENLQVSLEAAKTKLGGVERAERARRTPITDLGIPTIRDSR